MKVFPRVDRGSCAQKGGAWQVRQCECLPSSQHALCSGALFELLMHAGLGARVLAGRELLQMDVDLDLDGG